MTHNYDQFKDHATRVVKMHDGKIVEDTGVKKAADKPALQEVLAEEETAQEAVQRDPKEDRPERRKSVSYGTQVRLGLRNTFNLPAKFLLLLLVFLFVVSAVTSQYVSVKQAQDVVSETGWNSFFMHYDPSRIIVERQDRAAFTKADYEALENAPHVKKVIREDIMYDSTLWIEDFSGYPLTLGSLEEELTYGRLPKKDNEVVIAGVDDGWTFGENPESIVGNSYSVYLEDGTEISLKVVGLILRPMEDDEYSYEGDIFFTDNGIVEIRKGMYASRGTTTMHINGQDVQLMVGEGGQDCFAYVALRSSGNGLVINDKVPEGYILIPTSYDPMFKKGYAAGNDVKLNVKTLYYEESLPLTIMGTYGEKTFKKKTGLKNLSEHDGEIYINEMDYRRLYEKGSYQASVFVDDTRNMEGMVDMLERGGYRVLVLKDHIYNFMDEEVVNIITMPLAVIVCLAVFFIAYFVIRLILKSRGVYFATLRMLGMGRKPAKRIMRVELILVCLIAFAVFLLFIYLNYLGIIYREQLMNCLMYLTTRDYILLLLILLVMAVLIAGRFMRSIFKSSAMGAYREEA